MSYPLLDTILSPADLRRLERKQLPQLASELRAFLIESVSQTGGHLSSNLGTVELTIALHAVFNTPEDRLVWDVGHQCYPHKVLTGRREGMNKLRMRHGVAGFPKRCESPYDTFGVGHSSTSISAALGMALAAKQKGEDRKAIAIIGDGAMSAGMAFEALNNAGVADADMLVILNDNEMSISPPVVALNNILTRLTSSKTYNVAREAGRHMLGFAPPLLELARRAEEHVKGMFAPGDGIQSAKSPGKLTYTQVFGDWLCDMAQADSRLVGITPAMREGSGMVRFANEHADRYYDVGIAEQHAVTFAAGLACEGLKPVAAIYSTFLQRGYDQVLHDVCLQNLPVTFAMDRAGLVGADGATHAGAYDIAYLRCIPNMSVLTPADERECRRALTTAFRQDHPVAVRYPRGSGAGVATEAALDELPWGRGEVRREGRRIALLAFGTLLYPALEVGERLDATVANMRFAKPLDRELVLRLARSHDALVTLEEGCLPGGAGAAVLELLAAEGLSLPVLNLGLPDEFIEHGDPAKQLSLCGLDAAGIERRVVERFGHTPARVAVKPIAA